MYVNWDDQEVYARSLFIPRRKHVALVAGFNKTHSILRRISSFDVRANLKYVLGKLMSTLMALLRKTMDRVSCRLGRRYKVKAIYPETFALIFPRREAMSVIVCKSGLRAKY